MTDQWQKPAVPRYGEYAPVGQTPPQAPTPSPQGPYYVAPPAVRPPRTGDVIATVILLTIGVFATLFVALISAALPQSLAAEYTHYGITYHQAADYGVLVGVMIASHVILILVAIGVSIPLMVRRHRTFWIPLMCGIVAAIVFWAILIALVLGDGTILQVIQSQQ
jgi:hypothetical protein